MGYLKTDKFHPAWFTSLLSKAVQDIRKDPSLAVNLKTRRHGPAIQLKITEKFTRKVCAQLVYQLSVDEGNRRSEGENNWCFER